MIMMKCRPYFSVVISCYNPDDRLAMLLDSLVIQNEDIEVIISDDCSTKDYMDIVEPYKNKLMLKFVKTEKNFAPSITRETGARAATGKWLTFSDQDDEYYPESFSIVREYIEAANEQNFAFGIFDEINPESKEIGKTFECSFSWTHGKFYNLDNFWCKHNIHYRPLKTHEDIYLCSLTNCLLVSSNNEALYIPKHIYKWYAWKDSVSRSKYIKDGEGHSFLEVAFQDYIDSTGSVYLEKYLDGTNDKDFGIFNCLEVLMDVYFYFIGFVSLEPETYIKENKQLSKRYFELVKHTFNIDTDFILGYINKYPGWYCKTREGCQMATGPFVPVMTFKDFLYWIDEESMEIKNEC